MSRTTIAFDQAVELSRRSIVALIRQPQTWAPALIFPLLLSAQFGRAIHQPGFPPVDSFLDFLLPAAILQAIAFNATNGGADLAHDIGHLSGTGVESDRKMPGASRTL